MADIGELLYRIKDNIKAVEAGGAPAPLLAEIEADFLAFMELVKLFLISERDTYYGYFLLNMRFKADFAANSIAGIKLNELPPVLEANPLLLGKFSLKEILYIICHEIDHVVFNHPAEMVKANPEQDPDVFYRFNLAADAAVNDGIDHEIVADGRKFLATPGGVISSQTLAKMFKLQNVVPRESYAYYFALIAGKQPRQQDDMQNGQEKMMGEQGTAIGDSDDDDNSVVTAKNCGRLKDHDWQAGESAEDAAAMVREVVNSAYDLMNAETRGLMPAAFLTQVEKINEPAKLCWQAILKKYVGTIAANKRASRTRLNRRQPERFDLSGRMDEKILKIVVAIDTSGSVDDRMIKQIFNEIFAILAKRKHEVTVIECDAAVQRVYRVKSAAEVKTKVKGRGGTCFAPVIEHINNDRYFRDALLIYFTDGFGESKIPRPRTYRNIWVVFDDTRNLSVEELYGAVITL